MNKQAARFSGRAVAASLLRRPCTRSSLAAALNAAAVRSARAIVHARSLQSAG